MHQAVREKIAQIACYREGVNAHLSAAVELAEPSPGGLLMPNQPMMYAGRVFAIYLTDIRHREPVYRVFGRRLKGVYPVFTGLVVSALARPEWLVEVTVVAVKP
jgi:hypothetical protein